MGLRIKQLVEALRQKPEVAGSIPDGIFEIFYPSGCTMALRSTQALTKMSNRDLPGE